MPNQKKKTLVQDLSNSLNENTAVLFIDYRGLTHRELEELRNTIEKHNSVFQISKNTLLKLVLQEQHVSLTEQLDEVLYGPTASVFISQEAVEPIKIVAEFIKKHEVAKIKGGIIDAEYLDGNAIVAISNLPSKNELIGMLLNRIQAPIYRLAYALKDSPTKVVRVLNAVHQSKGGDHNG